MDTISQTRIFGGTLGYYRHAARSTNCDMRFSVFVPEHMAGDSLPVLWWLSGLTCTEDNFTVKAGAYRKAAELRMIIIAPDTSPRGDAVPDDEAYDLGQGAGFYLDATAEPWARHFNMYSYLTAELPEVLFGAFPGDADAQGICGHSMGGHGALTIGLKNTDQYRSISAFAPIAAPMQCPWGQKAFAAYLVNADTAGAQYDATALMAAAGDRSTAAEILIDQGLADAFLEEQLMPEKFAAACAAAGQRLNLRMQAGYDHSYFFIASFIDDHLQHHADILSQ